MQTLAELDDALASAADIVLLDNMSTEDIREAVRRTRGRAKIEISGGVTLERIPELAATGADYVSVGALTHSAPAIDISFEIEAALAGRVAADAETPAMQVLCFVTICGLAG